jgi:hypothetical protein
MAKTAKNQMKVKGVLKNYICTWEFAEPVENWSKKALVANLRNGIVYAIRQNIGNSIKVDEQIVPRWKQVYAFMLAQTKGDPIELAKMNAVCAEQNIKGEVQTHFIIRECDYMEEVKEPEPTKTGGSEDPTENADELEDGDGEELEDLEDEESEETEEVEA